MKCYFHDDRDAVGLCVTCGRALCRQCGVTVGPRLHCESCYIETNLRIPTIEAPRTARQVPDEARELRGNLLSVGLLGCMLGVLMPLVSVLIPNSYTGLPYSSNIMLMAAFAGLWLVPQSVGFIGLYRSLHEAAAMVAAVFGIIAAGIYIAAGAMAILAGVYYYVFYLLPSIVLIYVAATCILQAWTLISVKQRTGHDMLLISTATVLLAVGSISWLSILSVTLSLSNLLLAVCFLKLRTPPAAKPAPLEPTIDPLGELL